MKSISTKIQKNLRAQYGSWAVVTGASSGIGREMALCLAEAGLNLVLVARSRDVLEEIATDVTTRHGIETCVVDIDLSLENAVEVIQTTTHDLDVGLLIAAAGVGTSGSFLGAELKWEINMLHTNCRALLLLSLYFGRRFATRRRGGMVLFSSIVGFQGTPKASHYAATKAYIQSLGEGLHMELSPLGVDVLVSAPGPVKTPFGDRSGMYIGKAAPEPKDVVISTLNSLGSRSTVLPGLFSKLLGYSLSPLPRWMRVRIMAGVMEDMTKNSRVTN